MRRTTKVERTFTNRREAGVRLARTLAERRWVRPVVLGLARGGVPVAAEVARLLDAPLGVVVARKIGAPGRPEFGVGAVTAHGPANYDAAGVRALGISADELDAVSERERAEAQRRARLYQRGRQPQPVEGRDVIVVDDGLATGVTATAALRAIRQEGPRTLVLAAPVCAAQAAAALRAEADEVVCAWLPERFHAVGEWYSDFSQTTDDEVIRLLDEGSQA
ncbi:putative phosphoribosyltransferase [Saccharomonospora marina XMU15]|uniref:Putative phosphoribosyltransferase n=1 Tax=Saccharomonospora marina XMU15 TaxID=882083 RepID=H5XBL7_9PSEU|nr:phosphoribosyltransferase family protein [Saccharomonospora marina]EHR51592.1 putative phosphoribosyltransferase [Saccharomonospora marina XMU15]